MRLDRPFVLRATPLLRSLFAAAVDAGSGPAKIELAVRLMLHDLVAIDDAPTFLPLPTSVIGRRVAGEALADHRHDWT